MGTGSAPGGAAEEAVAATVTQAAAAAAAVSQSLFLKRVWPVIYFSFSVKVNNVLPERLNVLNETVRVKSNPMSVPGSSTVKHRATRNPAANAVPSLAQSEACCPYHSFLHHPLFRIPAVHGNFEKLHLITLHSNLN